MDGSTRQLPGPAHLAEAHRAALEVTAKVVEQVTDADLARPTPCEDWDVRALLNHLVAGNLWVGELVDGRTIAEVGHRLDGDVLGDDPPAAYRASAEVAAERFGRPHAMDLPVAVSYGPVPGSVYCGHRLIDVLVHGWDLAVATGQPADLPPDLVDAALEVVLPQAALLSASGAFGDHPADPGPEVPPQDRLLRVLGRTPRR
jgi:uncharacterized protein (TIGR03086 family)